MQLSNISVPNLAGLNLSAIIIHKATCGSVRPSETNTSQKGLTFLGTKGPEMLVLHILGDDK